MRTIVGYHIKLVTISIRSYNKIPRQMNMRPQHLARLPHLKGCIALPYHASRS
jgi:hypothetical protein